MIMGALDYILSKRSNRIPQVRSAVGRENLNYLKRLPERCKEHIWQFNVKTLSKELQKMNFKRIHFQTTYQNILGTLKRKDSWRITAF
jgi:hypothetical protein